MSVSIASSRAFDGSGIDGGLFTLVTDFARHTRWLNGPLGVWTDAGLAVFAVLILIGLWNARRQGARAIAVAVAAPVAVAIAVGVAEVVKRLVGEVRPCYSLPHAYYVNACPGRSDYAFPSAHSAFAFAVVAALWLVDRRLSVIAAGFAVFEGFTRVYLGDHYPHDIAGSIIVAMPVAYLISLLVAARLGDQLRPGRASPGPADASGVVGAGGAGGAAGAGADGGAAVAGDGPGSAALRLDWPE